VGADGGAGANRRQARAPLPNPRAMAMPTTKGHLLEDLALGRRDLDLTSVWPDEAGVVVVAARPTATVGTALDGEAGGLGAGGSDAGAGVAPWCNGAGRASRAARASAAVG